MDMQTAQTRLPETGTDGAVPPATVPHVVIVGGGFGGLAAAKKLAKQPVRVTVIERTNVLMAEVTGVDTHQQLVLLGNSPPVHYDYLVLATGVGTNYFGHAEWE